MQAQFSTFGWIVSIAAHAVLVVVLFVFGRPTPEMAPASSPQPEPPAEGAAAEPQPEVPDEPLDEAPARPSTPAPRPAPRAAQRPSARPSSAPATPVTSEPSPSEAMETILYTVKRGESLTAIANRTGVTLSDLAKLNKTTVKKLSRLWVGQRIRIPATKQP